MSVSSQQEITQLLVAWNSGDRFCCAKLSEELRMRYVSFFMAEKAYYVAAFATIHAVSRNKEIPKNKILSGRGNIMEISAYRYRQARFCCAKLSEELRMRYVSFFMAEKAYHVAAFATIHAESRTGCPDGLCYLYRVGCSYGDLLESARALGHIIVFMKMRSPHGIAVFNIAARKRIAAIRIIPPFFS